MRTLDKVSISITTLDVLIISCAESPRLNVNAIRLYQVAPEKTHAKFMAFAESLGLYVMVPLTGTMWGYLKADVPSPNCYTDEIDNYGNVGTNLVYNAKAIVVPHIQFNIPPCEIYPVLALPQI
jgi:hypothetical protein